MTHHDPRSDYSKEDEEHDPNLQEEHVPEHGQEITPYLNRIVSGRLYVIIGDSEIILQLHNIGDVLKEFNNTMKSFGEYLHTVEFKVQVEDQLPRGHRRGNEVIDESNQLEAGRFRKPTPHRLEFSEEDARVRIQSLGRVLRAPPSQIGSHFRRCT